MPAPYCYPYPRPAVTVDLVAFALAEGGLRVLFIERQHDPFAGRWALPGGFLEMDETGAAGARRELREETGFDASGPLAFLGVFDAPDRDPRGRTISLAHATVVRGPLPAVSGGDDAAQAAWLDPRAPRNLAFDHAAILAEGLAWLDRAVTAGPVGQALLPDPFGLKEVKALFRALGRPPRAAAPWLARRQREDFGRSQVESDLGKGKQPPA